MVLTENISERGAKQKVLLNEARRQRTGYQIAEAIHDRYFQQWIQEKLPNITSNL